MMSVYKVSGTQAMLICIVGAELSSCNPKFLLLAPYKGSLLPSECSASEYSWPCHSALPMWSLPSPPVAARWPPVLVSVNQDTTSPHSHLKQGQLVTVNNSSRYCLPGAWGRAAVSGKGKSVNSIELASVAPMLSFESGARRRPWQGCPWSLCVSHVPLRSWEGPSNHGWFEQRLGNKDSLTFFPFGFLSHLNCFHWILPLR